MKIKYFLISFVAIFGLTAVVNAQDNTGANDTAEVKVKAERQKRIEERKDRAKISLTTLQSRKIQDRCVGAQGKLAALQEIANKHSEKTDKKTQELIGRIITIVDKQNKNGQDVSKIKMALELVDKESKAVQAAYEQYALALADTAKIDCKTDTVGFKASLEDARVEFKELKAARKKLRTVIKEELKPALQEFRVNKNKKL